MDSIFTAQLDGEVDLGIAAFVLSLEVHARGKVDALRDLFLLASTLVMSIGPVFRTAIPRIEINYLPRVQKFVSSPVSMGKRSAFCSDFSKQVGHAARRLGQVTYLVGAQADAQQRDSVASRWCT